MGSCAECRCSVHHRDVCQDCGKSVCYKHRTDHSILLDWGDTDSQEYKCRECEDKFKARQRRDADVRAADHEKQRKMEELYRAYEEQQRLARDSQARKVREAAEAKLAEWEAATPDWLEPHREAHLKAWKDRRDEEWEARVAQLRADKLREFSE